MLQCSQGVARISTPRDAARPKGSHLVGPPSAAETRPDVRVPPLGAIFGFSAPNVARGVLKAPRPIAVAGAIADFAPGGNVDFGCDADCEPRRGGLLLLVVLLVLLGAQRRWLELGTLRVGDSSLLPAGARDTVRVAAWRGPASSACAAL